MGLIPWSESGSETPEMLKTHVVVLITQRQQIVRDTRTGVRRRLAAGDAE